MYLFSSRLNVRRFKDVPLEGSGKKTVLEHHLINHHLINEEW